MSEPAGSDPLERRILSLLDCRGAKPLTAEEIAGRLGLAAAKAGEVQSLLQRMEQRGALGRFRKTRFVPAHRAGIFTGRIQVTRRGHAFLKDLVTGEELFVREEATGVAMHGDLVVAKLEAVRQGGGRGMRGAAPTKREAQILRVLETANSQCVGTVKRGVRGAYLEPDDARLGAAIRLMPGGAARGAVVGEKVVAKLLPRGTARAMPEATVTERLGLAGDPATEALSILRRFNLPGEFPKEVIAEANRFFEEVRPEDLVGREDFRRTAVVTVDPDDARDFDDAIHVERDGEGWILQVHIADVSNYVTPGGALDTEARKRGNSVYLPDCVIPMLPERLSNGLCSLRPDVERLVVSAVLRFNREGKATGARFASGVIRSARRLTYREAMGMLGEKPRCSVSRMLHEAWELASRLRRRRFDAGALDLDFPEVRVVVDRETGHATGLERIENDASHQLIEEFMIAANEAVGRVLRERLLPVLYRVHEQPDPERLFEFRDFAAALGFPMGDPTRKAHLVQLLGQVRGVPEEHAIKVGLLRSLMRARYDPAPLGHYGLEKSDYLHFTSPIRRYADLIVHRAMGVLIGRGPTGPSPASLAAVAEHLSRQERVAAEAEKEASTLKKREYLARMAADPSFAGFDAVVTEARRAGLMVDVPMFDLSGFVPADELRVLGLSFDMARAGFFARGDAGAMRAGSRLRVRPASGGEDRFALVRETGGSV